MTTTHLTVSKFKPANENATVKTVVGDLSITVEPYVTTFASVSKPWRRAMVSFTGRPNESNVVVCTNTRSRVFKTLTGAMRFARRAVAS